MNYVWTQSRSSFLWAVVSLGATVMRLLIAGWAFIRLLDTGMTSMHYFIIAIIAIILMDHIDGILFEKTFLSQIEIWKNRRRILDSVCDRLCIQFFCLPILILQPEFIVIYMIILSKELMTSITCIKAYGSNMVLSSNTAGKVSCIAIGAAVITWLLSLYYVAYNISLIILVTGYISYLGYRDSYKKYLKEIE